MSTRFLILALAILPAGCAGVTPESDSAAETASEFATQATYQCESGLAIWASYPSSSKAVVEYQGQTYEMSIEVSASGARYVGGGLEWWTKGDWRGYEGTLLRHEGGGKSGEILEQCERVEPASTTG